jgi:hypothetical protein
VAALAALNNSHKDLEEQHRRERDLALSLEIEKESAQTLEHYVLTT